jgi:hypothetical protein
MENQLAINAAIIALNAKLLTTITPRQLGQAKVRAVSSSPKLEGCNV